VLRLSAHSCEGTLQAVAVASSLEIKGESRVEYGLCRTGKALLGCRVIHTQSNCGHGRWTIHLLVCDGLHFSD
jgi:hypothetical protein